jgi:hypothetical protein
MGGKDHFLDHLDDTCLLAFPQDGQMHGAFARDMIAASASEPGRWRDLAMEDRNAIRPNDDMAVISYRAEVTRGDGQPYRAMVGSAYVRRENGWKLAFHRHSPL